MSNGRAVDVDVDPGSLDEIDTAECWRLLGSQPVGRVAIVVDGYASVFPVNFALDGESIVFRTGPGTILQAINRVHVTFEVDQFDPVHRSGWSVMVRGTAHELTAENNPNLVARSAAAGATPWAPGARSRIVRMVADQVTGRRIRPGELPPGTDGRGYL